MGTQHQQACTQLRRLWESLAYTTFSLPHLQKRAAPPKKSKSHTSDPIVEEPLSAGEGAQALQLVRWLQGGEGVQ